MAWTLAAQRGDFGDRDVIGVACQAGRLALFKLPDGIFATSDICPHLGASLSQGCVVEGFVECPYHFALFDIMACQETLKCASDSFYDICTLIYHYIYMQFARPQSYSSLNCRTRHLHGGD